MFKNELLVTFRKDSSASGQYTEAGRFLEQSRYLLTNDTFNNHLDYRALQVLHVFRDVLRP